MNHCALFAELYLLCINIFAFALFGADKRRARRERWRVSEKALFLSAILGGSVGAILGMKLFRHKTKHKRFAIGLPAILAAQVILTVLWYWHAR